MASADEYRYIMTMVRKKRFTLQEYHRLTEIGFFKEDDRVELIQGEIMEMSVAVIY